MAGGETSGGLLLVAASEVFVEEEVICVIESVALIPCKIKE
jgi:hypothetical protein